MKNNFILQSHDADETTNVLMYLGSQERMYVLTWEVNKSLVNTTKRLVIIITLLLQLSLNRAVETSSSIFDIEMVNL